MGYAMLCYVILYCARLCCVLLYCVMLCYIVLCCGIMEVLVEVLLLWVY